MRHKVFILFFLCLTACSGQSPLPTDHYYHLPELTGVSAGENLAEAISVITLQGDGLYRERAILYTEDEIELKQYHYQHWADSPTRLIQERLAERLRLSNIAKIVLTTFDGNSELIIKGQIKAFERLQLKNIESVYVKLIFQVNTNSGDLPALHKEYIKTVALPSNSIANAIKAFAEAVDSILNDFYSDLVEIIKV